jgi:hypothetical protein
MIFPLPAPTYIRRVLAHFHSVEHPNQGSLPKMVLLRRMDVYTKLILLFGNYPSATPKVYLSSGPEEVSQSMLIQAKDADAVFTPSHDCEAFKTVGRPKE